MSTNLTCPIILNTTLNATLYQPAQPWLKEWSPILLGIAQVLTALALAFLTYKLWKSTSQYSNQVEIQTIIMKDQAKINRDKLNQDIRILRHRRLRDEMDKLVAPLFLASKMIDEKKGDLGPFNLNPPQARRMLEEKTFFAFQDRIRQNAYLSRDPDLKTKLEQQFSIYDDYFKNGLPPETRENYILQLRELVVVIKKRYPTLLDQINEVESDLSINVVPAKGSAKVSREVFEMLGGDKKKGWWQFWK